jgi:23S rRNA (cytosine1962-C5)-methyltransferase
MDKKIPIIVLKTGKDKQPKNHHPWVFSGAIAYPKKQDINKSGHVVKVVDSNNEFIAYGWCDINSHIMVRLLSWSQDELIDDQWVMRKIKEAVERRKDLIELNRNTTTAFRLIHGEADFLPGVAVDLYGTSIVILLSARVALAWEHLLVGTLQTLLNPKKIFVHIDSAFVHLEHLENSVKQYIDGEVVEITESKDKIITCMENDLYYIVSLDGQKSGFYCDQRENRAIVAPYAKGKEVLDLFSYTGGFTLNALQQGAEKVTCVDSSQLALTILNQHVILNAQKGKIPADSPEKVTTIKANVFEYLREMNKDQYDLIIIDPPKLAANKGQVAHALKAYKDLNRLAIEKVKKGGLVATFSCSAGVSLQDFQTAVAWAAKDAKREIHVIAFLNQSSDHPVRISFPESNYLKGFLLRII